MQERHSDRKQYFRELAHTTEKFIIPFLEDTTPLTAQTHVLEIGCGEGGNLEPFVKKGCKVTGIDLSLIRIEQARQFLNPTGNRDIELIAEDIFSINHLDHCFDLILIHDVIEHIPDKKKFINHIERFLKPGGSVFLGFPAWQMPFGGHQQICRSKIASHLPYFHILPKPVYKTILKLCKESSGTIDELLSIKACGITIEQFRHYIRGKYIIKKELFYFINPHYETKFGLKPRHLSPLIGSIPWFRNFFTTSCFYIIQKQ